MRCGNCDGTGKVQMFRFGCALGKVVRELKPCTCCGGTGKLNEFVKFYANEEQLARYLKNKRR